MTIGLLGYIVIYAILLYGYMCYMTILGCFGYIFKCLYGMYIIWLYCYMAHRLFDHLGDLVILLYGPWVIWLFGYIGPWTIWLFSYIVVWPMAIWLYCLIGYLTLVK
jgi:hypothetical protein